VLCFNTLQGTLGCAGYFFSLVSSIVILPVKSGIARVCLTGLGLATQSDSVSILRRGCRRSTKANLEVFTNCCADDVAVIEGIFNCIALARD